MNTLKMASNPMAVIQSMMTSNPQLQAIMPLLEKNNGDYRKTFFDLAEQRGIDPKEVLNLVNEASKNNF